VGRGVQATRGTALVFAMSGVVQASWMSRLPAVRDRLHTDVTGLGLTLVALGVGTLLAMAFAGWACRRYTSRRVAIVTSVSACVMLGGIGAVSSPPALGVVLFLFGMAVGAWDAAMNVQGPLASTPGMCDTATSLVDGQRPERRRPRRTRSPTNRASHEPRQPRTAPATSRRHCPASRTWRENGHDPHSTQGIDEDHCRLLLSSRNVTTLSNSSPHGPAPPADPPVRR
jgi:hypothetical protein